MGLFDGFFSGFGSSTPQNNDTTFAPAADTNSFNVGQNANQPDAFHATDPVGPSGNPFVNSFEASRSTQNFGSTDFGSGTQSAFGRPTKGTGFIQSYEASGEQQPQVTADAASEKPKADESGAQPTAGGGQGADAGSQTSPANNQSEADAGQDGGGGSKPNTTQQGGGAAPAQPPMRPDLGDSVKSFESGNRGVASVSGGVDDPGGVSYGTYQLNSQNGKGTVKAFLDSPEGGKYASEFMGLTPGSPEFSAKWADIADKDPDALHQAEKAFIYRTRYLPVFEQAREIGLDMNNPAAQEAVWSGSIQHGKFSSVLGNAANADPYFKYRSTEDQLKALYWARGQYADQYGGWKAGSGRYFGGTKNNDPGEFERIKARNEAYKRANERH